MSPEVKVAASINDCKRGLGSFMEVVSERLLGMMAGWVSPCPAIM